MTLCFSPLIEINTLSIIINHVKINTNRKKKPLFTSIISLSSLAVSLCWGFCLRELRVCFLIEYINFKDFVLPKDVLQLLELIIFFMGTFPIILIINSNLKYKKKITIFSKFYINFFKFPINLTIFIFLNYFIIRITTKCLTTS